MPFHPNIPQMIKMTFIIPVAVVALLPLAHAVVLVSSGSALTSSTIGITVGSTTTAAAAATLGAAALVAGALVVGGVALASRHKRDVSNFCLPSSNPDLFLDLATRADQAGCGLRLVCELEASPDEDLSRDEHLILNLFGLVRPPSHERFYQVVKKYM